MAYNVEKYNGLKTAANSYNSISITLGAFQVVPELVANGFVSHYIIAKIIYQALFCEVALKALIVRDNNTCGKIHLLDKLFSKLDSATQQLIFNKTSGLTRAEFDQLLIDNNNLFVKWRYFYEGNTMCNPDFMDKFSLAVREVLFDKTLE